MIYADKNKLSSFGTQKGYPVVARLANLEGDIRNGAGIGSGQVVGWLPVVNFPTSTPNQIADLLQVDEEASETGKKEFADFKHVVWHDSFSHLLKSLQSHASTGYMTCCGDNILRWLFPLILIVSADYEEM